jgi:hypothetical protein
MNHEPKNLDHQEILLDYYMEKGLIEPGDKLDPNVFGDVALAAVLAGFEYSSDAKSLGRGDGIGNGNGAGWGAGWGAGTGGGWGAGTGNCEGSE